MEVLNGLRNEKILEDMRKPRESLLIIDPGQGQGYLHPEVSADEMDLLDLEEEMVVVDDSYLFQDTLNPADLLNPDKVLSATYRCRLIILGWLWIRFLFKLALSLRQRQLYFKTHELPQMLQPVWTQSTFRKARLYSIDLIDFKIVKYFYTVVVLTDAVLHVENIYALLLRIGDFCSTWMDFDAVLCRTVVIYLAFYVAMKVLQLPLTTYEVFVLEETHGFNQQSLISFWLGWVFEMFLGCVVGPVAYVAALKVVQYGSDDWVTLTIFMTTVVIVISDKILKPHVFPFLEDTRRLPEGSLRMRLESLAEALNYGLEKIEVQARSRKTLHSRSCCELDFRGFIQDKILTLDDTLIQHERRQGSHSQRGLTGDQVTALTCHRMAHRKPFEHFIRGRDRRLVYFGFLNLSGWWVSTVLFDLHEISYGIYLRKESPWLSEGVYVFQLLLHITFIEFMKNWTCCYYEFKADEYAVDQGLGDPMKAALIKFHKDNLIYPFEDPFFIAMNQSTPSLIQRLNNINTLMMSRENQESN